MADIIKEIIKHLEQEEKEVIEFIGYLSDLVPYFDQNLINLIESKSGNKINIKGLISSLEQILGSIEKIKKEIKNGSYDVKDLEDLETSLNYVLNICSMFIRRENIQPVVIKQPEDEVRIKEESDETEQEEIRIKDEVKREEQVVAKENKQAPEIKKQIKIVNDMEIGKIDTISGIIKNIGSIKVNSTRGLTRDKILIALSDLFAKSQGELEDFSKITNYSRKLSKDLFLFIRQDFTTLSGNKSYTPLYNKYFPKFSEALKKLDIAINGATTYLNTSKNEMGELIKNRALVNMEPDILYNKLEDVIIFFKLTQSALSDLVKLNEYIGLLYTYYVAELNEIEKEQLKKAA